jgi:hypothetical protein
MCYTVNCIEPYNHLVQGHITPLSLLSSSPVKKQCFRHCSAPLLFH